MSIPFAEADGKNKPLLRRALLRSANQHDSLIFLLYPDNNNDVTEDDRFKLIFTCPGDDTYYIKLKKGEKLYIEDLEDTK